MTTIELVGTIVAIGAGAGGLLFAFLSHQKEKREERRKATEEAIALQKKLTELSLKVERGETDMEEMREDFRALEQRYMEFMRDVFKLFQTQ